MNAPNNWGHNLDEEGAYVPLLGLYEYPEVLWWEVYLISYFETYLVIFLVHIASILDMYLRLAVKWIP